jgi:hypothetical protein
VTDGTAEDPGLKFSANLLGATSQPTPAHLSQFLVHSRCTSACKCGDSAQMRAPQGGQNK